MELDQHAKGAESRLPATAGAWSRSRQGPARSRLLPGCVIQCCHHALLASPEVPSFIGQGALFPQAGTADASLPLLGGWQVPSARDSPPKCSGVEGVVRQRQPASATGREGTTGAEASTDLSGAAHSTQIWAGDLLPSLLFLDFLWKWQHSWATNSRFYLPHEIILNSLYILGPA